MVKSAYKEPAYKEFLLFIPQCQHDTSSLYVYKELRF